jgi:hypothetical protein
MSEREHLEISMAVKNLVWYLAFADERIRSSGRGNEDSSFAHRVASRSMMMGDDAGLFSLAHAGIN